MIKTLSVVTFALLLTTTQAFAAGNSIHVGGMTVPTFPVEITNKSAPPVRRARVDNPSVSQTDSSTTSADVSGSASPGAISTSALAAKIAGHADYTSNGSSGESRVIDGGNVDQTAVPSTYTFAAKLVTRVEPGVNDMIRISKGHLNRLVTPFLNATVETTSTAQIKPRGSSVYVEANQDGPVTMFIHEHGEDDPSMSITLLPDAIPPRQVYLRFKKGFMTMPSAAARRWETSQPFIESTKRSLREIAKGRIPDGYGFRAYNPAVDPVPWCQDRKQGIKIDPAQVLDGSSVFYVISKVTNVSDGPIELDESKCYARRVLAVAFWPNVRLEKGQSAELYELFKKAAPQSSRARPSLLGDTK